ncbi:MAG: precorrin-6A synthase (deacetylating) [Methyloceanibacter sp.]
MKRKVLIIGIGAGNPEHVTVQAVNALNRADVFFIPNKGAEKTELARLRYEIVERFAGDRTYRLVDFDTLVRDSARSTYLDGVDDWHDATATLYGRLLREEIGEEEWGAFLVWGDPGLYDSILRILERVRANGELDLDYEVIPGISSVQALAAAHKIPLNRIGAPVTITTGRKLAEVGLPSGASSVVVMLDGQTAFKNVDLDVDIYWGAYLGTDDEILISGKLRDVIHEIEQARRDARERKGWIMDTYLLRRPDSG